MAENYSSSIFLKSTLNSFSSHRIWPDIMLVEMLPRIVNSEGNYLQDSRGSQWWWGASSLGCFLVISFWRGLKWKWFEISLIELNRLQQNFSFKPQSRFYSSQCFTVPLNKNEVYLRHKLQNKTDLTPFRRTLIYLKNLNKIDKLHFVCMHPWGHNFLTFVFLHSVLSVFCLWILI